MSVFNVPSMTLGGAVGQPPPLFNPGGATPYGAGPTSTNTGGSNQYGSGWPVVPSPGPGNNVPMPSGYTGSDVPPGAVPPAAGSSGGGYLPGQPPPTGQQNNNPNSQVPNESNYYLGGQHFETPPINPGLTNSFTNFLQSQVGQGVTPFNLSAPLPTGGSTLPGQLSPGLDPISQALESFYSGGSSSIPGSSQLSQMAQTGDPISALPEWNAMVQAMQQQIGTGAANVKEMEAGTGNIAGSGGALASSQYQEQTSKDLNAQLVTAQTTALENAKNRQLGAGEFLQQGASQLAPYLQGLDQNAITQMYNEFIRTQPQYNPLLGYQQASATTFPPTYGKPSSTGALGGLLSGIGGLFGGIASGVQDLSSLSAGGG